MHYKKRKEDSNAKITLPQSEHIDSFVKINTLHCPANPMWREACHAKVALLSSVHVFISPSGYHLAFQLLRFPKKKKRLSVQQ
jgi:hypothetical protein